MNLFYVDLEPANNKDVYGITAIQNKLIQIEPPQSTKPQIPLMLALPVVWTYAQILQYAVQMCQMRRSP